MTIEVLKRKNKYILILILSCIFTISTCKLINKVHANNTKDKGFNVLVLNSYHQGHIWESSIFNGLLSYIENNNERDINFNIEYLDFKNNNNKKYIKSFKNMLNEKYAKGSIDAVYTVDDEAYDFFSPEVLNKESNFYKLPLVFSGVDSKISRIKEEKSYMAGIYHEDDSLNLINLIYDLNPKIKNINLIIEDSKYGDSVKYEIERLVENYLKEKINIQYIKGNYIEDIISQLKKIESSDNTVNIIAGEFQSISSKTYKKPKYIVDEIKKYSNAPIYSNDQTYMNAGVVGGHIDIGEELGEIACDMLVKLRKGVSIEDIKNTTEPIAKAYVDYKSIYEYNINPFFVDKDVNVINKEFFEFLIPIWMKLLIIIIIIVIIILILVISQIATKHRKIKEKELEEKQKALEREKLKSDFIVNLSHELRTPINIILGTTRVLECSANKKINSDYLLEKIENINKNSYRLLKISNNIIDITKAESGMFKLKLEKCNIVSVIENIFESSLYFAKRKNIKMIFDTKEEEINTAIDVFQIQRVVLNLISNAIKFTHENGNINLSMWTEAENILIEVEDDGEGIPSDKLNYIFYRFYQVENLYTRKNEGSGIGLCIVKEIVEIHGGKIEIESEVNKGSKFRVYLPLNLEKDIPNYESSSIIDNTQTVNLEMSDI